MIYGKPLQHCNKITAFHLQKSILEKKLSLAENTSRKQNLMQKWQDLVLDIATYKSNKAITKKMHIRVLVLIF